MVATVPHSWNQYDSGRITRTTEPRDTISICEFGCTAERTKLLLLGANALALPRSAAKSIETRDIGFVATGREIESQQIVGDAT